MIFLAIAILFLIWKMPLNFDRKLTLACDPTGGVLTTAIILGMGAAKANAQIKEGQAQKRYYNALADTARSQGEAKQAADQKQAEIAEDVGAQQVKTSNIQGAETLGSQRTALAANQISGSGSAQDILLSSLNKQKTNEANLKYNADTKAWSFETEGNYAKWEGDIQGSQYDIAGKQALSASKRQAAVTMLSSVASVYTGGML